METTIKVEGMMCMKCAGRVKKALEALPSVTAAEADPAKGTAVITSENAIPESELKAAVENVGYTFRGISA